MASQVVDRERLEAAIDVHDVRKSFGRTTALNGVSFSVPEGNSCSDSCYPQSPGCA